MFSDSNPEDIEKTTLMNDETAPKEGKKSDEWVTAPMPAAKPKSKAKSAPSPSAADVPPAPVQAAPAPASMDTGGEAPPSSGGFGSFLSKVGINDPNTQKWVLIIGGVLILLCCLCVCLVVGLPTVMGLLSSTTYY
jgi:hypothetical protein